jgi:hypothetical protein
MDRAHFKRLLQGVKEMKLHLAGKRVRVARVTRLDALDMRSIRKATKVNRCRSRSSTQ